MGVWHGAMEKVGSVRRKDMINKDFYRGKRVFITGHTGFKGTWLTKVLVGLGADVIGYSIDTAQTARLYAMAGVEKKIRSIQGDVRNLTYLTQAVKKTQPEIIIHLAAQPIVREGYKNPVDTYATNVMGTVNILETVRITDTVKSFINVTTDKVYLNKEYNRGYRENEELNGYDPYSNSKSCSELVTSSYQRSFFEDRDVAISTARAGNVIGGGDFAVDRIIPDCVRAIEKGEKMVIRHPYSVRPYQHVLEPVMAYLMIAQGQYEDKSFAGNYNVGPDDDDCITTGELVKIFAKYYNDTNAGCFEWIIQEDNGPHEASCLKLDCTKLKKTFDWKPKWNIRDAVSKTVDWTNIYLSKGNVAKIMEGQISEYMTLKI